MCKCTAEIVWEWEGKWEEQCFAAEYVWEFMRVWGSVRVVERGSVRVVEVLWFKLLKVWELCDAVKIFFDTSESCVRCESLLLLVKYSLNTYPKQTKHGHYQVTTDMTKW